MVHRKKTGKLIFDENEVKEVTKWAHIKHLYNFESKRPVKVSDLNEISIAPKSIGRQQVSFVYREEQQELLCIII